MTSQLKIEFGAPATAFADNGSELILKLQVPLLAGEQIESFSIEGREIQTHGVFSVIEGERNMLGVCAVPCRFPLQETIYNVYSELLQLTRGWDIYRIWNFVPFINEETDNLENYKSFSIGRSLAYERRFGDDFHRVLPSASAVGVQNNTFALYFAAGRDGYRHVENPEQVSAFHYPAQYGPRPPSFARGTRVDSATGVIGYLSGTAAIKGHDTLSQGEPQDQCEVTFDNLALVLNEMGFSGLDAPEISKGHYKVYIRRRQDADALIRACRERLGPAAKITFLLADICRADLLVEVDGVVLRSKSTS